jgi:uncharacterized ferritin-like protein (DUF455 family)
MDFFNELEKILETSKSEDKIKRFREFYSLYLSNDIKIINNNQPKVFKTPSFSDICNIVDATTMQKRGSLSTDKAKAYLIHTIAHIEYSAIDLALDHAYRFRDLPKEYYDDWLEVASDEIRHFLLLEELLTNLGYKYGDFDVHSFLFDTSQKTLNLLSRMAVVPRYLEASGLDSNPMIIKKLKNIDDDMAKKIISALEIILEEEIDHVKKGDRWFKYACKIEGIDPNNYFDIVEKTLPEAKRKKPFVNVKHRQKAGFSCDEIRVLTDEECK